MRLQDGLDRMPQKGPMQLIERIVAADATTIHCVAKDHSADSYPLRIDGHLPLIALVELGAQAAAAHASLFGIGGHHAGLLLALHGVEIAEGSGLLTDEPLQTRATQLHFDEAGARYSFEVSSGAQIVLSGQAMLRMEAVDA